MKREVMESAGLELFAEIGLILFVVGFMLALIRVFLMNDDEAERMRQLPLESAPRPTTEGDGA